MMTYMLPIPSQIRAKEYLKQISHKKYNRSLLYTIKNRDFKTSIFSSLKQYFNQSFNGVKIRLGGHSKGGNLAVYAACNNDGPTSFNLKKSFATSSKRRFPASKKPGTI